MKKIFFRVMAIVVAVMMTSCNNGGGKDYEDGEETDRVEEVHSRHAHDEEEDTHASADNDEAGAINDYHAFAEAAMREVALAGGGHEIEASAYELAGDERNEAENDTIDCLACDATGLSYAARQTRFEDRDMISAWGGLYNCPVCHGKKKVKRSEMYPRWHTDVEIRAELADIDARRSEIPCSGCDGSGKCWQCNDELPYRNSECYCGGSGKCRICHGQGHL